MENEQIPPEQGEYDARRGPRDQVKKFTHIENIGKQIRAARRQFDITQLELSAALGHKSNNSYISHVENGYVKVSDRKARQIFEAIEQLCMNKSEERNYKDIF